jgi:hypothetical protein
MYIRQHVRRKSSCQATPYVGRHEAHLRPSSTVVSDSHERGDQNAYTAGPARCRGSLRPSGVCGRGGWRRQLRIGSTFDQCGHLRRVPPVGLGFILTGESSDPHVRRTHRTRAETRPPTARGTMPTPHRPGQPVRCFAGVPGRCALDRCCRSLGSHLATVHHVTRATGYRPPSLVLPPRRSWSNLASARPA